MRYLKVDVKELHSPRLARLAGELNISATEALGILIRFWAATQSRGLGEAKNYQLQECVEAGGPATNATLMAMCKARYIIHMGNEVYAIPDNAGVAELSAKRAAAGRLGAVARSKPKAKARAPKVPKVDDGAKERGQVWAAYESAYERRWNAPPVRNRKANSLIAELVRRLGATAAQAVVQFYVAHNDGFYLQKTHDLQFCIRDCETLHTQMQRGRHITRNDVRQAERENHHLAQLHRVASGEL